MAAATTTEPVESPEVDRAARRILPVLFIGVFMAALDTAIIAPAIPALRQAFGVDNRQIGLVTIVFVLCSLSSTALMARLSDRYGRRLVYLSNIACFALGSLAIALAPSFWVILVGRAIQGLSAGGITPTAGAVIGDAFPPAQRGKALGLIGATFGMAFVLGPPVAGVILAVASWQWIFLLNLPIAVIVIVLGLQRLPANRASGTQLPLDLAGIVVTFLLLSSLVLGITRVADQFVGTTIWPGMLGLAALMIVALIAVERRAAQPMIPLDLFRNRQLSTTYLLTVGAGFGMGSVIFLTSIAALTYSIRQQQAGFVLLPLVICSMIGSMGAGRMLNQFGSRGVILFGFAALALGYGLAGLEAIGFWGFLAATLPIGLGVGIVVGGALRAIAIDEAPLSARGAAQGLINIATSIGNLLAAAAIGALADLGGGNAAAFGTAYGVVAIVMLAMCGLTMTLRPVAPVATPVRP